MEVQQQEKAAVSQDALLIDIEKAMLEAFKNKDEHSFTKKFAGGYIGVANDGVKDVAGEVKGMYKLNLNALCLTGESVYFPSNDIAIITYKMMAQGVMDGRNSSGLIHCSSVYMQRDNTWEAILHTESKAE